MKNKLHAQSNTIMVIDEYILCLYLRTINKDIRLLIDNQVKYFTILVSLACFRIIVHVP